MPLVSFCRVPVAIWAKGPPRNVLRAVCALHEMFLEDVLLELYCFNMSALCSKNMVLVPRTCSDSKGMSWPAYIGMPGLS
eukprot:2425868-Pyramimonas_sp.AAC.1